MRLTNVCRTPDNLVIICVYLEQLSKGFAECRALQTECSVGIVALSVITVRSIDGFHGAFYHGNWRALHHHAAC